MKVADILEHFLAKADWIDRTNTVDRVLFGDPQKDVDRCLVTWMPNFAALRHAVDNGFKLIIGHEPLLYHHRDDKPEEQVHGQAKLEYARSNDLVVLRNHDAWDRWPEIGIPWAWREFLGLEGPPAATIRGDYQHRYDIEPVTLRAFAESVAQRCGAIGEPMVQVTGDLSQKVSKIGIGTGCGCKIENYLDMGCDCSVVCDDGSCYWAGIQMAEDIGHPVIRVNHGTSEEAGMVTLTNYINQNLEIEATHLPHGSTFTLVG